MRLWFATAVILPGLLWRYDATTSTQLKNAAIPRVYVPDESLKEWRSQGLEAAPVSELASFTKVPPPVTQMRIDQASATSVPWIEANGWRFLKGERKALYEKVPKGRGPIATAEAFAYGVDAVIEPAREDLAPIGQMIAFERRIGTRDMPPLANIGIVDDGSEEIDEVLNLMSRRNLLYKVVKAPDPSLDLNVQIGTEQYPREAAKDPNDFAARVREKLSDEKRLVRLFGSYTVIAYLTGEAGRARLHLLNYGMRPVEDLRVRVRGKYKKAELLESTNPNQRAVDTAPDSTGIELTVPKLAVYAVVDLE